MKPKLLFIEDEEDLGNVVKQYLEIMDFDVSWCTTGNSAFQLFSGNPRSFNLLIIDIQLPDINGFDLVEQMLNISSEMPFLYLTARKEKEDKLRGLRTGADDYITKPFDIEELILRIRNILKRNKASNEPLLEDGPSSHVCIGDISLNKDRLLLSIAGNNNISLTLREAELLEYLCLNPNKILKREFILIQLWGENDYFLGRSLDVFISRLRKLLHASNLVSIDNVYGIGFIFNVKNHG